MKYLTMLLLTCIAAAFAQPSGNQLQRTPMDREAFQAAAESLNTFRAIVTDQNFRQMGFVSPGEVKTATLGQPLPVLMVQLDDLRAYRPGTDPGALLRDLHKVIFPVLVDNQVRSSITVERRNERWQGTGFGAPKLARVMESVRRDSSSATGVPPNSYVVVHVAALNRLYLGHRSANKLMLTTIVEDPMLKLPAGKEIAAEDVFQALVPIAQRHNGLPS